MSQEKLNFFYHNKDSVFYPRYGEFETLDEQRKRCQNVHKLADLAVVPNEVWNQVNLICNRKYLDNTSFN